MEKNSLNNFICHLSLLKELSRTHTHPAYHFVNFQNPMRLFLEFESFVKCDVISMGGWVMQGLSGVSHTGVGWGAVQWVMQ